MTSSIVVENIETRLFINNEYVDSVGSERLTVVNPFTQSVVTSAVHKAGEADVNRAVAAAEDAFRVGPWSKYTGAQRAKVINKFADLLEANRETIGRLESMSMGGPFREKGILNIDASVEALRYYAGWADKLAGQCFPPEGDRYKIVRQQPLGVCAAILAWNATLMFIGWKGGPALATGNTIIFKSSEKSPLGCLALGALVKEAGFPPGVIQFLSGDGSTGNLLASHMKIAKISFTGSSMVGRKVQIAAATSNLKRVTLELGGKSPAVVFEDADIGNALFWCIKVFMAGSGQICAAASRLFIHESIAEAFIEKAKEYFAAVPALQGNDPTDASTFFGPIADEQQFSKIMAYIEQGKKDATLAVGGKQSGTKSYFVEPTIFLNPTSNASVYREEIFGPVLCVKTFKTEEEAITLANDTAFGLAGCVFTQDMSRALRFSERMEAGSVGINATVFPTPQTPFGGSKLSGIGRELGTFALAEYTEPKTVTINLKYASM